MRRDPPEYKLIPHLAESYSTDDRIVWTFNLRRGIKFHTGNEMQADDVKFSIERVARWEGIHQPGGDRVTAQHKVGGTGHRAG